MVMTSGRKSATVDVPAMAKRLLNTLRTSGGEEVVIDDVRWRRIDQPLKQLLVELSKGKLNTVQAAQVLAHLVESGYVVSGRGTNPDRRVRLDELPPVVPLPEPRVASSPSPVRPSSTLAARAEELEAVYVTLRHLTDRWTDDELRVAAEIHLEIRLLTSDANRPMQVAELILKLLGRNG